jgi:hypothetical protein
LRPPASALPVALHESVNGMLYPHRSLDSHSSSLALLDQLAPDTVYDQLYFPAMGCARVGMYFAPDSESLGASANTFSAQTTFANAMLSSLGLSAGRE